MANIKQFTKFAAILKKHSLSIPKNETNKIKVLIDDILFDFAEDGKIETERLFLVFSDVFGKDEQEKANKVFKEFGTWAKSNNELTITESKVNEVKGRVQTLTGKAKKKREAKAKVISGINKDPRYIEAKNKFLNVVKQLKNKHAKAAGVSPALVDVDKVTARADK